MAKLARLTLLPLVAALTLSSVSAQAIAKTASAPQASSNQCTKYEDGKVKAKPRGKLLVLCEAGAPSNGGSSGSSSGGGTGGNGGTGGTGGNGGNGGTGGTGGYDDVVSTPPIFTPPPKGSGSGPNEETETPPVPQLETFPPTQDVPEPGSLALLGLGLTALGLARRRRGR